MEPLANLNGERMPLSEARVPVLDRGFLFGDSIYEVLRVYAGKPWLADEHFQRLKRSLDEVRITGVDVERVRTRMAETIAAGPFGEALVYIQITRGVAPRSHAFPADAKPTELLYVQEYRDGYGDARRRGGAAVITHPDLRWKRCDVKSTNLLGNVLAMQAAKEAGAIEALLYHEDGSVVEASHNSLFGVRGGVVVTAPRGPAILPGITREFVIGLARQVGLKVREEAMSRDELTTIDELFLTGTTSEVLPLVQVDGRPVASGVPGPVTRRLQEAYTAAVRAFLAG